MPATRTSSASYFNPRSPHGERRPGRGGLLAGTDAFQPTLPARGATRTPSTTSISTTFQPTLPARGATSRGCSRRRSAAHFNPRSPHGERLVAAGFTSRRRHFNPRSPHGERRIFRAISCVDSDFNPRSPHGERHDGCAQYWVPVPISTHAPRTGSDAFRLRNGRMGDISTHAPRTGSDMFFVLMSCGLTVFQPTLPARGATQASYLKTVTVEISTHAPRTGSDARRCWVDVQRSTFQPTLPARGATASTVVPSARARHFNPRSPHGERPGG